MRKVLLENVAEKTESFPKTESLSKIKSLSKIEWEGAAQSENIEPAAKPTEPLCVEQDLCAMRHRPRRQPLLQWQKGQRVRCAGTKGGQELWFSGTIQIAHKDGSNDVMFDDGLTKRIFGGLKLLE